jgi:hypothetical protein
MLTGRRSSQNPLLSPTIPSGSQPLTSKEMNLEGKHADHSTQDVLPLQLFNWQWTTHSRAHTRRDSGPLTHQRRLHATAACPSELPLTSSGNVHAFYNHASIMGCISHMCTLTLAQLHQTTKRTHQLLSFISEGRVAFRPPDFTPPIPVSPEPD